LRAKSFRDCSRGPHRGAAYWIEFRYLFLDDGGPDSKRPPFGWTECVAQIGEIA